MSSDDYRSMYGGKYVGAWDLEGKGEVTVTIASVRGEELTNKGGKDKRPVLTFKETEKSLVLNKGNGKTIATLYGTKVSAWVGKRITLYATKTQLGGDTVDAIRVRPQIPVEQKGAA